MTSKRLFCIGMLMVTCSGVRAEDQPSELALTYEADVKPILKKHCLACHNTERPRGDLDLSSYAGVMAGGISGKAVLAKRPDDSPLYTMTAHLEDPKMPPNKPKIPQREIDTIRKWIDGGLVEKVGAAATPVPPAAPGGLALASALPRATPITALAVSPVATLIAVPGMKQVLLYNLAESKWLGGIAFPEGEVHALRFSHDGKVLLAAGGVGGQSGAVVGYEVGTWKRLFTITDDTDAVLAADISADRSRIAFGGPGRVVKVVSVPDGKLLHTLRKPTDWVLSVRFSPEGLLLAAGDRFGGLYVWEAKSGKDFLTLRGHKKGVTALAWRVDTDVLASCSEDGSARLWNMHTGDELTMWEAHASGVLDVAFPGKDSIATAGRDGRVKLWNSQGKGLAELGPATDAVMKIAFTPDAKTIIAGDWAGDVSAWPVSGGAATKLALPIAAKPASIAMVPVPTPPVVMVPAPVAIKPLTATQADLVRKRAALKAVEDAVEKLKDEAARNPKNPALAKAYLQLCEAALALKADLIEAEAAAAKPVGEK